MQGNTFMRLVSERQKVSSTISLTGRLRMFCRSQLSLLFLLLTFALMTMTAGCNHAKKIARIVTLRPSELTLDVGIDPAANGNRPVAVDIAFIKDKNFWKAAPAMTAKDWFGQRSDLQRRYGKKLQVHSWEWVPGQPVAPITLTVPRGLSGAMIFAGYPSPGTHSAPVPLGGQIAISLLPDDFTMKSNQ